MPLSAARAAVGVTDVAQAPPYLGSRVGGPVSARTGHLVARQCLRDAERAGRRVLRLVVPAAFGLPQGVQAPELVLSPPELAEHLLGDISGDAAGDLDADLDADLNGALRAGWLTSWLADRLAGCRHSRHGTE